MIFTSNIMALFLLITLYLAMVSGSALPLGLSPRTDTAPQGYEIVVPKWTISHRGEDFELYGSNKEAHSYMKARFSDYEPTPTINSPDASQLERRAPTATFCIPVPGQPWGSVLSGLAQNAVAAVKGMTGALSINAGCYTRVYCNGNANIWVCNQDTPNLLVLPVDIAAAGQAIIDGCSTENLFPLTGGQAFDADGFNVIISSGDCNDIQGGNDWTKRSHDESKQLADRDPGELARRDMVLPPHCQPGNPHGWPWAYAEQISDGINLLNSESLGDFLPGGHSCEQAWCGGSASIWLCNDNDYYYPVLAATVASYAEQLVQDCNYGLFGQIYLVGGQLFSTDSFNVIVKGTSNNRNCDGDHL